MLIPQQILKEQKADGGQTPVISTKWVVLPLCLLIIFSGGIFLHFHRPLSAGGIAATTGSPPVRYSGGGQVQDIERMARGTDELATKPSIWPTGGEVTSGFGWRISPWGEGSEYHAGIDIANNMETPIVATADGKVVQSGWSGGYGNVVQIDHGNGLTTIYGHNSRLIVDVGQSVQKGQIIAYLGSTGRSTGPHLHYEIRENGTAIDPIGYLVQY